MPHDFADSLGPEFFERDAREVAQDLLGKTLLSRSKGALTGGVIVETEAYLGSGDSGSHASTKGITARNAVMYGPPGHAYVYFTYGNHYMLNLVTEPESVAGAVLIRALEPTVGIDVMRTRRVGRSDLELTNGPGKLAAALGLDLSDNAGRLGQGNLAVLDAETLAGGELAISGRIGLSTGHELLYRYYVRSSRYVSKGRTGPPRERVRVDRGK